MSTEHMHFKNVWKTNQDATSEFFKILRTLKIIYISGKKENDTRNLIKLIYFV